MRFARDNRLFRPALWPSVFLILALPVLLWLGVWQVQRLDWKLNLIARIDARVSAPPIEIATEHPTQADEYRAYQVTGLFLPDREFHWLTTSDEYGIGYLIFSPFELADGRFVIVNQGFIPASLKDDGADRAVAAASFVARARTPEKPGALDAANDEAMNIWFTRDTVRMAELSGGAPYLPIYLEQVESAATDVWPKPGAAKPVLVNNHLDYALTWFGLAIVLIGVYVAFHLSQGRIGRMGQKQS